MEFTKYFATINREIGIPGMSKDQFARMMNIVTLESKMKALQDLDIKNLTVDQRSAIIKNQIKIHTQLKTLTGNKNPEQVFSELCF